MHELLTKVEADAARRLADRHAELAPVLFVERESEEIGKQNL